MKKFAPDTRATTGFTRWHMPALPATLRTRRPANQPTCFEMLTVSREEEAPELDAAWRHMLAAGSSPEKMFQTPDFFRYLQARQRKGEAPCTLHLVRRQEDGTVVGVVPGREGIHTLDFRLGRKTLFKRSIRVYQILGSVPLLDPYEKGLEAFVADKLLDDGGRQALLMQAFPADLADSLRFYKGLSHHALHGWRDCHTMPLPASTEDYLQKFSAKKRYNLSRQIRQLEKQAGPLVLERIERLEQTAALADALDALQVSEELKEIASRPRLEDLASHGLLLSYLLQSGGKTVGLVLGTHSDEVWHVHNICHDRAYQHLSAGTSVIHLALQDVIQNFSFTKADFGYGTPNQEFRSTHVMERRGTVMLFRRRSPVAMLFRLHGALDQVNQSLASRVKALRKSLRARKQRAQDKPGQATPAS